MNKTLRNLALLAVVAAPCSAMAEITGSGTADDPYVIASADDLCEAHNLTKSGETIYFVQTADIDMTGKEKYSPFIGFENGGYDKKLNYDGKNHVIKNFAPVVPAWGQTADQCYGASIFGVANGAISNLGVIDANCKSNHGTGIIGAYGGHGTGGSLTLTNVYVTGTVDGTGKYNGGMLGCTGNNVTMVNCFANVNITSTDAQPMGGLVGRANNPLTLTNCYVAGTVPAGASLVAAGSGAVTVDGLVVFNTGSTNTFADGKTVTGTATLANTTATEKAGLDLVKSWDAFSATAEVDGYPALNYTLSGAGTEADPYIIASANDLCHAWTVVDGVNGCNVYFVQTADIDMGEVENYTAVSGWNGAYKAVINYDGQNHLIKNFMPTMENPTTVAKDFTYYCTSVFGVASGKISNLGVVNAYCTTTQGAGILGGYAGHGTGDELRLENVFVEGTVANILVDGKSNYAGGMFGCTGNDVTMVNCYANVQLTGSQDKPTGGLIGRMNNFFTTENVYVAGTVAGEGNNALLCSGTATTAKIDAVNTICFNTGADKALVSIEEVNENVIVATEATKDALIAEVQEWDGFQAGLYKGYPALAWQDVELGGIFDVAVDEAEANGPAVYYNLQGVQVTNPENGIYIVRRGNKVTKELVR